MTIFYISDKGCSTKLNDGAVIYAEPEDNDGYRETARSLGYGADTLAMCIDHEELHTKVALLAGRTESFTLRAVADGYEPDPYLNGLEEAAVLAVQKYRQAVRKAKAEIAEVEAWFK